jgi:hypothetical protein
VLEKGVFRVYLDLRGMREYKTKGKCMRGASSFTFFTKKTVFLSSNHG